MIRAKRVQQTCNSFRRSAMLTGLMGWPHSGDAQAHAQMCDAQKAKKSRPISLNGAIYARRDVSVHARWNC
jgi:hypothetical protein